MSQNIAELVKQIYPQPDPTESEEQADRYTNRDLSTETVETLRRELTTLHLLNFLVESGWHRDRETAVASELTRRRLERRA